MLFKGKKGMDMLGKVLVVVALVVIVLFAYLLIARKGTAAISASLSNMGKCGGLGRGDGYCLLSPDSDYTECPSGTEGIADETCARLQRYPATAAGVTAFGKEMAANKKAFETAKSSFEAEAGIKYSELGPAQKETLRTQYYGFCCVPTG